MFAKFNLQYRILLIFVVELVSLAHPVDCHFLHRFELELNHLHRSKNILDIQLYKEIFL